MAFQDRDLLKVECVPYAYGVITGAGNDSGAIWRVCNSPDLIFVTMKNSKLFASKAVPDPHSHVIRACGQMRPVRREDNLGHTCIVTRGWGKLLLR
jgi:hypothetical protein